MGKVFVGRLNGISAGVLTLSILAGTLIADLLLPLGYAAWSPYLLAIMVARYWAGCRAVIGVTIAAAVLTLLDIAFGAPGQLAEGIVNRMFGVCLIALAGGIAWVQSRSEAALTKASAGRHRSEAALVESEQRFRAFMDHNPAVAWMKDADGRYVYLSKSYERRHGALAVDACGKTDFELWPAEQAACYRENDLAVLDGNGSVEIIEPGPKPGDHSNWWVLKFPFQDSAGRRYVGGVALDISARIRAEEAKNEVIAKLQGALQEIKTLRGLIPICSYCKKIRDDAGFWQQLEQYLIAHTDAQFTHGICPVCLDEQLGPEYRPSSAEQGRGD
jgi:PAS domain S-box-containing protein